jgi:hypothetical protein
MAFEALKDDHSPERKVLRELAKHVAEIAALPIQAERRELWKMHNNLQPVRPMILLFPEGSWEELHPLLGSEPRSFGPGMARLGS